MWYDYLRLVFIRIIFVFGLFLSLSVHFVPKFQLFFQLLFLPTH